MPLPPAVAFRLDPMYLEMLDEIRQARPGTTRVQALRDLIQDGYNKFKVEEILGSRAKRRKIAADLED